MPEYVYDGNTTFGGGQNDGILSDRIRPDQYRRGVNVTTDGGGLRPRPGYVHREITVCTDGSPSNECLSYAQIFKKGKFQAAAPYDTDFGNFIIMVVSGIIFRVDPRRCTAQVIELEDGVRLNQYARRVNWSYAGRFLVLFDNSNAPVIIDQDTGRLSSTQTRTLFLTDPDTGVITPEDIEIPEIPSNSCLGAFVNNRLHVSNGGHEWGSGDPIGGINEDAPITFEESLTSGAPFNGQFFSLGSSNTNNEITYMGFLQIADTSTGYGPLIVATKNAVYSYRVDQDRTAWDNGQFGSLILYNAGIAGPRAAVNVNSDLLFMSGDCQIRSIHTGREEQNRWSDAPISREIEPFLVFNNPELKELTVAGYYNNRVFFTVNPYRTPNACDTFGNPIADYAHCGMVVLELDNVSGLFQGARPAWSGLWTGIDVMEMLPLEESMYFISKDSMGVNRIYELDERKSYDVFRGQERQIRSRVYTRTYDFQNRFVDKEESSIDYTFSNLEGDVKLRVDRRAGHGKNWRLWREFNHCAPVKFREPGEFSELDPCEDKPCPQDLPNLAPHCFRNIDFGDPEEEGCDEITKDSLSTVRKTELRLDIDARDWLLEELRLKYELIPDSHNDTVTCDTEECVTVDRLCNDVSDWDLHSTPLETERGYTSYGD